MLPLAMNWNVGGTYKESYSVFVLFNLELGKVDYIFTPYSDDDMREIVQAHKDSTDLDDSVKTAVELSMLARSDVHFGPHFLDSSKQYTADDILNMDFFIDKAATTDNEYMAAKMSMDIRRVRGWGGALIFELVLPPEHFILLTGKHPHNFVRGSIATWDSGWPRNWNALNQSKMLPFGGIIYAAIAQLKEERSA